MVSISPDHCSSRTVAVGCLKVDPAAFWQGPWRYRDVPRTLWFLRPKRVRGGPVLAHQTTVSELPQLVSWTGDGGPFVTLPLVTLTGGNLAGARLEAIMSFPGTIQKAFNHWQVGSTVIDDRPVQILQGTNAGETPVNLYFDESGLLVRLVRWNKTTVGTVSTQIDYADYREVAGVKLPFRTTVTWTDGQNAITLKDVRTNVPIEAARFARPEPFKRR